MKDIRYKIGDTVFFIDNWDNLRTGTIYELGVENVRGRAVPIALIYENGRKGACIGAKIADCYPTKEACLTAAADEQKKQTARYMDSIKNTEDLVRFLFEHDTCSEYRDYAAIDAAKARAKELLGVSLD